MSAFLVVFTEHSTVDTLFKTISSRVKMPTNFTVVPVEDAEGGSKSTAAAGGSKPAVSLGKFFVVEEDEDSLEGPHSGIVRQNVFLTCRYTHTLRGEIHFQ